MLLFQRVSKSAFKPHINHQLRTIAMHQAQVQEWGQAPQYTEVAEPPAPSADEIQVRILGTGLHRVVRSRAAGKHYSSGSLPHVPGVDGVGETKDGQKYYFFSFGVGAMADIVNVPKRNAMLLPEGVDPRQAAGMVNPAMSSWLALKKRTTNLPKEFTVLIVGATSASGRVAIPLARSLGAKRVIGAARNKAALETLGLDESVVISDKSEETDFTNLTDVDVILDYIYGPMAEHLLKSIEVTKPLQYVHIGALSSPVMNVPAEVLRSKDLTIRGSGPGAWSNQDVAAIMPDLLNALKGVPEQPIKVVELADVEKQWSEEGKERVVFVP